MRCSSLAPAALALTSALLFAPSSHAEEASGDFSVSTDDIGSGGDDDSAAFVATGKVGGIVPFGGLKPFVSGGVELGWIFGGTGRSIGALLDVTYTTPQADGAAPDTVEPPRVADGQYDWKLTQKILVFQPTFLYRFTGLGTVTPYAGIGPRIYLLESVSEGEAGGETIGLTQERSTKLGAGLPLGAELALGPGGLMAELLFQWGPLDHDITGDSHNGAATLFVGYRALL